MGRRKEYVEAGLCGKGLHPWGEGWTYCKECKTERSAKWRAANPERWNSYSRKWGKANPERVRELNREWVKANPERRRELNKAYYERNREERRAWAREWRKENLDIVRERGRAYYERNREEILARGRERAKANRPILREYERAWAEANREWVRERTRRWHAAHPGYAAEQKARRKALKAANGVAEIARRDVERLLESPCAHAHLGNCDGPMQLDHVVPLSRGGRHSVGNLQPLCRRHNASKNNRFEVEVKAGRARREVAA